jgi:hypothetical protein
VGGLLGEPDAQEAVEGEGGVPNPGVTVVPVALAAYALRQAARGAATIAPVGSYVKSFSVSAERWIIVVPIETAASGYFLGAFFLLLCLAVFLTNQFDKWTHMEDPPFFAVWLQRRELILSEVHHDIHHASPYDTYYCITVGVWNPLLDQTRFFERTERLLRPIIPGADARLRSNERAASTSDKKES